jgi:hypothetical protein
LALSEHGLPIGEEEGHLAVEDVERLVVAVMHVQRRHVASPPDDLAEVVGPRGLLAVEVDIAKVLDEPERLRRGDLRGG